MLRPPPPIRIDRLECQKIVDDIREVIQHLSYLRTAAAPLLRDLENRLVVMREDIEGGKGQEKKNEEDSFGFKVVKGSAQELLSLADSLKLNVVSVVRRVSRVYGPNARECL